ncbi:MAG: hypothetical protein K2H29_11920 [Oscillospiraceae bacterium]|nr:hypothetical protein [Oscillospiraceae bacterium]
MAKFDFNAISQPVLEITMPDKEHSRLRLTTPSTSLVERFGAASEELDEIFAKKDSSTIQQVYRLIAEILSCNLEFRKFTAEELKEYLSYDHIVAFVLAYMQFLADTKSAKN